MELRSGNEMEMTYLGQDDLTCIRYKAWKSFAISVVSIDHEVWGDEWGKVSSQT